MKASAGSSTATWRPGSPANSTARPPERFALSGRSCRPDPRTHAYRNDVADIALADRVFAPHYVRTETSAVRVAAATLHAAPAADAPAVSQLLFGERFELLDLAGGWAWGRCGHDDYVGYLRADALGPWQAPSHRVVAPTALVFAAADIKSPVVAHLPLGSLVAGEQAGAFVREERGFVHLRHLAPIGTNEQDPAAVAERLVGQPYRWGGRGGEGIDCSGLIQVALGLCGIACPRDSDMQRALGHALADHEPLRRGDIVCFEGHVGMMIDGERMIHANAHWMAVKVEPLAAMRARADAPALIARRRLP